MKILVLTDLFPTLSNPNHGIFIYQWAYYLAQSCDLTVYQIVFKENQQSVSELELKRFRENYDANQRFAWTQRIKTIGRFDRIWRRSRQFYRQSKLDLSQTIGEFDIIIGQMGCPGGYAAVRLAKKFGKKSIVGLRGSDVNAYLSRPVLKHYMHWTLKNADILVTVSEAMKVELIKRGYPESKINVIYNGVDEKLFHPLDQAEAQKKLKLPPNYKYLLFVGTLSQRKGINLLLSAFAELNRPEVKLILIGQGNDRHLIENFRIEHSLQDRILLSGVIPHAQLPLWYAASDVVVLPSLSEGVPNVILEALAIGKPVVASQVGGIPEVLAGNKAAFLCQPGDLNSLFEAIKKALNYSSKIEPFHKFTWEMNTKQFLQIFQEVIRR
ncbi:MAG TPA: glycosyltransferase [Candidatus Marinimicrobia bacterium]|nr:glycosyltransferase [Candidatus Neomarinimicrobiota bacterium]HQC61735.1 glycosyltransferase [Candidatus Neomarinimicrobiota bacterium]